MKGPNLFLAVLFCILFGFQSTGAKGDPLSAFIKENNLQDKRVLLLLLNVNDCVKCKAMTHILHDSLRKEENYYFLVSGVKRKTGEHYLSNVLKLNIENTRVIVNDSLFTALSPDFRSLMVVLVGETVYSNKKMEEVKPQFFGREISATVRPKDSTVLQENLDLLYGEYFPTTNITESNFLLYDRQASNLIKYGKDGRQIKLVGPEFDDLAGPDSTFLKYIYYTYWPGRVEWDTVSTHIYYVHQFATTIPINIIGAYNENKQNTYLLTDFALPVWDSILTNDGTYKRTMNTTYVRKTFVAKYDTGMRLIKEYLVSSTLPGGYYFPRSSEFMVVGDTLYRNIRRLIVNNKNDTASFLLAYYLDQPTGTYVPFKLFGRMPEFFLSSWAFDENKLYYDEATGNLLSVFSYNNFIYDQKSNKTWGLPGVITIADSATFNTGRDFKNIHYFTSSQDHPSPVVNDANYGFTESEVPSKNFVYWYKNKLYLIRTDSAGLLKRRWNLLDHGLSVAVSCFNDKEYLYVVSSREDDVIMYRFPLSDFR